MFLISSEVYCCDCSEKSSIEENWEKASQVFIGKVVKVDSSLYSEYGQKMYSYTIKISKIYKDEIINGQSFRTILGVSMGSCDYYFEKGKEYLIYTKKDHNALGCSICSRTNLLQNIQNNELKLLDELYSKSKKNRGVQIIKFQNNIEYQIDLVKKSFEEKLERKNKVICILSGLSFILFVVLLLLFLKNKRVFKSND
ncbi:hypothetical protein [uncultured Flavobacterium sp.]|uniref:hypothetical protein n=1 Tax=uncultured Flavobacterium sp. TaxID=165435 RepID=UPI00259939EC|nr:hypothetical protein [uncultured Flavobacterium sp.]